MALDVALFYLFIFTLLNTLHCQTQLYEWASSLLYSCIQMCTKLYSACSVFKKLYDEPKMYFFSFMLRKITALAVQSKLLTCEMASVLHHSTGRAPCHVSPHPPL